ncbi:MAG: hypothetical protein ACKO14_01225 [Armatimonadota bacterium]
MTLTLEELALVDGQRLLSTLNGINSSAGLTVRIGTDMLCNHRSDADCAFDWLAVLMLGEHLEVLGCDPSWAPVGEPGQILAVDFKLNSCVGEMELAYLHQYAAAYLSFYTDGRYGTNSDSDATFDYEKELLHFEDNIQTIVMRFHDIAKLYTACFVGGLRENYLGADYVTMLGIHQLRLKKWLDVSALRCSA